jgi:hypothetical protein
VFPYNRDTRVLANRYSIEGLLGKFTLSTVHSSMLSHLVEPRSVMSMTERSPWKSMCVDEYAALEIAMGAKLVKSGGVWWREVRPFFYRPLLPFREFDPKELKCPPLALVGGAQHAVPNGTTSNSRMNFLIFEDPHSYSMESLTQGSRRHIRRAMSTFTVKPIDLDELIAGGHSVYLSFYERTKYRYKSERTEQRHFDSWANRLFRFPKVQVHGAFRGSELKSVSVSYVVEDILFTPTFFSHTDALSEFVSELMLHSVREQAAGSDQIGLVFAASADMQRGLVDFYLLRGARVVSKPARLRVNPLALASVKIFNRAEYSKLRLCPESSDGQ